MIIGLENTLDMMIAENLETSAALMTGIVLKDIARELSCYDLEWDSTTEAPRHPLARIIYTYVRDQVEGRIKCKPQ